MSPQAVLDPPPPAVVQDENHALTVLIAGGRSPDLLARTVDAYGARRTWCAVRGLDEAVAVTGVATAIVMDPWPGARVALGRLAELSRSERGDAPVAIVRAGTRVSRRTIVAQLDALQSGAGLTFPGGSRTAARGARMRLRLFPRAHMLPGSGMILRAVALDRLLADGWFDPAAPAPRLARIRELAGRVRVVRGSTKSAPFPAMHSPRTITALVPAHNEEQWIGHTIRSLLMQTRPPDEIIVIDDESSDRTGEIARALGVRVLRPPVRRGRKASALNYGMQFVRTDSVLTLDADTLIHPDTIELLLADLDSGKDATSGAVLPLYTDSFWSKGRSIEYSVAMRIYKPFQRSMKALIVMSGCLACYRTDALRAMGGFSERTVVEDIDASWAFQIQGGIAGYVPKAIAYTVEPPAWPFYKAQMRRWASAYTQAIGVHRWRLRKRPALGLMILASVWDILTTPILMPLFVVSWLLGRHPAWLWLIAWEGFLYGLTFAAATSVIGLKKTLAGFPSYFVMIWTNLYFFFESMVREWIFRRRHGGWGMGR